MANLPIGERNALPQSPFQIQIDPLLPGQTTIGDLSVDVMQKIFSEPPQWNPTTCYKTTCKAFTAYYHEPTIRKANDLLLKLPRLLTLYGIPCREHIQTYAAAVELLENTRKIIPIANKFLPEDLELKDSPEKLIANSDISQTSFENAEDQYLVKAFAEYCPTTSDAPIKQRASKIRDWIKDRKATLTSFDLIDLNLSSLPAEVFKLKNVKSLSIDTCHLSWLTPLIKKFKHLTDLDLRYNELSSLPNEISELKHVKFINLSYNKFESIPPALKQLPSSVHICLAGNSVTPQTPGMEEVHCQVHFDEKEWDTLVTSDHSLNQVESSDSSSDKECEDISTLPQKEVINIAKHLQQMNKDTSVLKRCSITCSESIETYAEAADFLGNIKKTLLHANKYLPAALKFNCAADELLANCDKLKNFLTQADDYNLAAALESNIHPQEGTSLTEKAAMIRQWIKSEEAQQLSELNLSNKNLLWLPLEVCELSNLKKVSVDENKITSLPPEIAKLKNLDELDVGFNQLSSLPSDFDQLMNLRWLDLTQNKFVSVPPQLVQLPSLKTVYLGYNKLSAQSPGIEELMKKCIIYWDI